MTDGPDTEASKASGDQEPIRFSLSDREPDPKTVESLPARDRAIERESKKVTAVDVQAADNDSAIASEQSTKPELDEPILLAASPKSILEPLPPAVGEVSIVDEPIRASAKSNSPKRYRPPVAVKSVPLEIERISDGTTIEAPVHAVQSFEPNPSQLTSKTAKLTPLQLDLAQVRSLTLGGNLRAISVADSAVCKAVATGPRQVKLIGTGEGVTQLVVLAEGQEPGTKLLRRSFEIHVNEASESHEAHKDSPHQTSEMLIRSIRKAFPNCDVAVIQRGKELTVAGRCDSQSSAKKIMRMVRKTYLVPVRDELIVQ